MSSHPSFPLKGKSIFYFEDNLSNRSVLQFLLERQGARFGFERWVNRDTLKRLSEFMPVDLIFLDLMFPDGVTGYDIFDQIRACSEFTSIPVVAISAADPSLEMKKVREKGFHGFIAKPVSATRIVSQVAKILNGEQIWYGG